jgi:hypothetical protein
MPKHNAWSCTPRSKTATSPLGLKLSFLQSIFYKVDLYECKVPEVVGQSDARKGTGKNEAGWLVVAFNQASVMRPSLTCPVCLDLTPNHLPTTRWQFKVTENLLIECALHFAFSELEISCLSCAVCAVIKNGIEMMSRGEFRDELEGLSEREGCFIVQKNSPFEVEVFGEDGDEDEAVRMQFYVEEGKRCV